MDHSSHDHSMMDHSGHGGMDHGDMGGNKCNMNVCDSFCPYLPRHITQTDPRQMLFTWDTSNLCIVFRQWHITSNLSLVVSLAAIVAICAGYEALREGIRRYEAKLAKRVDTAPRKLSCSLPLSLPTHPYTPILSFIPSGPDRD